MFLPLAIRASSACWLRGARVTCTCIARDLTAPRSVAPRRLTTPRPVTALVRVLAPLDVACAANGVARSADAAATATMVRRLTGRSSRNGLHNGGQAKPVWGRLQGVRYLFAVGTAIPARPGAGFSTGRAS